MINSYVLRISNCNYILHPLTKLNESKIKRDYIIGVSGMTDRFDTGMRMIVLVLKFFKSPLEGTTQVPWALRLTQEKCCVEFFSLLLSYHIVAIMRKKYDVITRSTIISNQQPG